MRVSLWWIPVLLLCLVLAIPFVPSDAETKVVDVATPEERIERLERDVSQLLFDMERLRFEVDILKIGETMSEWDEGKIVRPYDTDFSKEFPELKGK